MVKLCRLCMLYHNVAQNVALGQAWTKTSLHRRMCINPGLAKIERNCISNHKCANAAANNATCNRCPRAGTMLTAEAERSQIRHARKVHIASRVHYNQHATSGRHADVSGTAADSLQQTLCIVPRDRPGGESFAFTGGDGEQTSPKHQPTFVGRQDRSATESQRSSRPSWPRSRRPRARQGPWPTG